MDETGIMLGKGSVQSRVILGGGKETARRPTPEGELVASIHRLIPAWSHHWAC